MVESDTSDQWHVLARLSGNVEMYGGKTADSGTDNWNIGIADPDDNTDSIAVVSLRDGSVVTSGDYERFFVAGQANATTTFLTPQQGIRRTAACAA